MNQNSDPLFTSSQKPEQQQNYNPPGVTVLAMLLALPVLVIFGISSAFAAIDGNIDGDDE